MTNVTLENELRFHVTDAVGIASKLTDYIANQAKTNIKAMWAGAVDGKGYFSFITADNDAVKNSLKDTEFSDFMENQVVVARVPDQVGSCADLTKKIGDAGINIHFIYTTIFDNEPAIVLHTEDNQKALDLLS